LRFRKKIFTGEITEVFAPYRVMKLFKSQLHFLNILKDATPQARRKLLTSADEDLINVLVECAINTLNSNHKLTKDEKIKLNKYEIV